MLMRFELEKGNVEVFTKLLNQRVKDYRELVKSRSISNAVIEELGLKDISSGKLSEKLTIGSKNDTRVIHIFTEDKDPEMAMNISNKVADIFKTRVVEIM